MVEANPAPLFRMGQKQLINASKAMSYLLRHGAEKEGIMMRPDGFIFLADLLSYKSMVKMKVNEAAVMHIVANNDKKRFEVKEEQGVKLIRAV